MLTHQVHSGVIDGGDLPYREQEPSFRKQRARERMAQWLGAPASIAEVLALVLSSHMGQLTITCHSKRI